ncbi:hypothetical protein HKX48_004701, partial [Thoreauomyces humboldtii]
MTSYAAAPNSAHSNPEMQEAYNEPDHLASPVHDLAGHHEGNYQAVSAYAAAHDVPASQVRHDLQRDDEFDDPESVLHRAADDNYSEKSPKLNPAQRMLGFYKPVYDYKTPNLSDKERRVPRYCGGRFRRWQFIMLHLLIFLVIFLVIIIPIGYFVVIPKMVQHELNKQSLSTVDLQQMGISRYEAASLGFSIRAALPAPHWLPITVEIGASNIRLYKKGDTSHGIINLAVPAFDVTLNKGVLLALNGSLGLQDCDVATTAALVQQFSSSAGLNNVELQMRANFPVKMFGITWYKGLPLYFNLGQIDHTSSNLKSFLTSLPSYLKSQDMNAKMKQHFAQKDLISIMPDIGFPEINIQALDVVMNDNGVTVATTVFLENPTKIDISQIQGLSFGIEVENSTVLRANVRELALVPNDINKLDLTMDITFSDPSITKEKVAQAIQSAMQKLLVTGDYADLSVALVGPVTIDRCDWVQSITSPLAIYLPMKEFGDALHLGDLRQMLTLQGVSTLAASTKISANVLSDSIVVPATIGLPRLLALPPVININYNVSAAIYGGDQRTLGIDLYPLTITTSDTDMQIATTVVLHPVNTVPAATALATALNPLLAAVPSNSSINLKEVSFFSAGAAPFAWSQNLFNDSTIALPLPPILCIPCLLDAITKNGTEVPFSIRSLAIAQLATAPGFSALGSASIVLPASLPAIEANLGFASLDLAVEKVPAASVALPVGLKFQSGVPMPLNAQAVISRDPALPAKAQHLATSFLSNGTIPSSIGISNLMFGPTANTSFVTFSQLNIELSTASFQQLASKLGKTLSSTLLKPGMVKPTAVDLAVVTPTTINLGLAADFINPVNISVALGNIDADFTLGDGRLATIALPPLTLSLGPGGLNLNLAAGIATGANGMAAEIATLANELVGGLPITALFGATNLVLSPPGTRGTASPAIINQFQTLKIQVAPSVINDLNPIAHPDTSPIDLSAILPGADIVNQLAINPQAASLETLPGAVLAASAAIGYNSPLAIEFSVPFAQVTIAINDIDLVIVQIWDLIIKRGQALFDPRMVMAFDQTDGSIPDLVAEAVTDFLAGHITKKFSIKDVFFGTAPGVTNDLFSQLNVDLRPITNGIDTNKLIDAAKSMIGLHLPMKASDLLASAGSLVEGTIGLNTLPQKTLGVNAAVGLKLPFQLTLNVGYLASKVGINSNPLLGLLLPTGIKIVPSAGTSNIALNTDIPFEDDEAAQDAVGHLVANFFEGSSLQTSIDASGLGLGASAGDTINALSQVALAIQLDSIIALDGPSDIFSLLGGVHPAIGGANLETRPGNNLGLVVNMGLQLPLKIQANVGYMGAGVGLNQNPMLDFELPTGIVIDGTGAMTQLNLNTELKFVDTEATQNTVNDLVNNLIGGRHLGTTIGINQIALGASATDLITALSKVQLPADLERGMGVLGITLPFNVGATINALHTTIHSVKLHTAPGKSMLANAAADFDLPFPVGLTLGYAGLSANMDGFPLADVNVGGGMSIAYAAGRGTLNIPQDIVLQFTDVMGTEESLRDLVDGFVYSGNFNTKAGINTVHLGNSAAPADRLTIVNKIDVSLALRNLLVSAGIAVPMNLPQLSGVVSNLGTLMVSTAPAKTLAVQAGADFNLPVPFAVDIDIGHVALSANLDGQANTAKPVANVDVPSRIIMNTLTANRNVQVAANIEFTDNGATQSEVNSIVQQALGTNHLNAIAGANGFQLGDSATDLITAFNLVNIRLDLGKVAQDMGVTFPLGVTQLASNLNLKVNALDVATAPAQQMTAHANMNFDFPLPVSLVFTTGYFFSGLLLDNSMLGSISLPTRLTLSSLGPKTKTLDLSPVLTFGTSDALQTSVARLVDNALGTNAFDMVAGIAGPEFGFSDSAADTITILSKVAVELSLDTLLGSMGIHAPLNLGALGSAALADGDVTVKTLPQKTLEVVASVGLNLAIPLSAHIGFFGANVGVNAQQAASADVNPLATIVIPQAINITSPGVITLGAGLVFTDTDATQTDIATLANRAFNGPALNGHAGLNSIKFGYSATDTYQFINKVNAKLALDAVAKMAGVAIPVQLGGLASDLKVAPTNITLATLPGGMLDVAAQADLTLPFRLNLDIGHFGTSLGFPAMNNNDAIRLLDLSLPIQIAAPATGTLSHLDVKTTLAFNQVDPQNFLKEDVNTVVNYVLNGGATSPAVAVSNVQLGFSMTDLITAFDKVNVAVQLGTFLPGLGISVPLDITHSSLLSTLAISGDAGVKMLPGKIIAVNGSASVNIGFDIHLHAGWVGAEASVNNAPLARVGMPLVINPDANHLVTLALNTNVDMSVEDPTTTPPAVKKVVTNYFNNVKLDSTAGLSQIAFGASQTDVIVAFSGITASIPLDGIIGSSRINLGNVLAEVLSEGGLSSLKLAKLIVDFTPDNLLNFGLGASIPGLVTPLHLTATVPYAHASAVAMDSIPLADVVINDFTLTNPFAVDFMSVITVDDSDNLENMLGQYMMSFIKTNQFPGTLELGGLTAGASAGPADLIVALSQSVIPITLQPALLVLLGGSDAAAAAGSSALTITSTPTGGIEVDLNNSLLGEVKVTLNQAGIQFLPGQSIAASLAVGLQLQFPLTLNVPFLAVNFGLDTTPFMGTQIQGLKTTAGTNGTTTAALQLGLGVKFIDSDDLATKIAALVSAFVHHQTNIPGYLVLTGVQVGASATSNIKTFQKVVLPLPVSRLLGIVGNTAASFNIDPLAIIQAIGLHVSNFIVQTQPGRKVHAGVTAGFNSKFPVTISGLNYFSLAGGIDVTPVVGVDVSGLNLAAGANNMNIAADMTFPTGAQAVVAKFFKDALTIPTTMTEYITVSQIAFGVSQADAITCFDKALLGVAASSIFGSTSTNSTGLLTLVGSLVGIDFSKLTVAQLMQMIQVSRAIIDLGTPGQISTDVAIGIGGLPLNVDIDIGYFSTDISLMGAPFTSISLPQGVHITTANGIISVAVDLTLVINDNDAIATIIAGMVNQIITGATGGPAAMVGIAKMEFGASASDYVDTFSDATISIDITSIIAEIKSIVVPLVTNLISEVSSGNLTMPAGWGVDAIDIDVAAADTLGIDLAGHSPNNGNFGINLPYATLLGGVGANIGVTATSPGSPTPVIPFAHPEIDNFLLKDGKLSGHVGLQLIRFAPLISALGPFLGDLTFHRPFSYSGVKLSTVGVSGILFGTKEKPFKLLSKINIASYNIESMVDSLQAHMNADPLIIDDITAVMTQVGFSAHVRADLALNLPINLKFTHVDAMVKYAVGGVPYIVANVPVSKIAFTATTMEIDLQILPDTDETTGVIEPLYDALPKLLEWQSYSHLAILGYATITGSNGVIFTTFDQIQLAAPDLTFWFPLNIDLPVLVNPIQQEGLALLPLGAELWWPNPYDFALTVGTVSIELQNDALTLLRVATNGPAYILNRNNGGTVKGTKNFILAILFPMSFSDLLSDLLHPIKTIEAFFGHLRDLFNPAAYHVAIDVYDENNVEIAWITKCLGIVFTKRFATNSLGPILGAILTKSVLHVFGAVIKIPFLNIANLPFIKPLVDTSNTVLAQLPPQIQFGGTLGSIVGAGFDRAPPLNPALLGLSPV